jgi:CRISPR-associated endonuclease/helicase Cas3
MTENDPLETQKIPDYYYFWAKLKHGNIHRLIYHLIDVAECAQALWIDALSDQTRQMFSNSLALNVEETGKQIAFWAALHDIGKAAPGFQRRNNQFSLLEKNGFLFSPPSIKPASHGVITTWALRELLVQEANLNEKDADAISIVLGGHHGKWPTSGMFTPAALQASDKGDGKWNTGRMGLLQSLKLLYPPVARQLPESDTDRNIFFTLLSGFISVADWIGSIENYFPFNNSTISLLKYSIISSTMAKKALKELGWLGWKADGDAWDFPMMFQGFTPNSIQRKTFEALDNSHLPVLVILEAPTGIGKTETALFLADQWMQKQRGSGFYIAMPSQATSNQMHSRVIKFLENRYPTQSINVLLVHGAALINDGKDLPLQTDDINDDSVESNVKAESWFLPRKRSLLAPFGIGTVDQALLSILQTRHFFVRLFGLGQKVVIFDEVHAYDTYMSILFQRLLSWLHSIDTSVILLSATLSEKTRHELIKAWGGLETLNPSVNYPRLTFVSDGASKEVELPSPVSRKLTIEWIRSDPEEIAVNLSAKLQNGGCAAVICNRVRRAREVFQAIQKANIVDPKYLILFHARYPYLRRNEIEELVLARFKHNGQRPEKSVVVATQVIEQSLDLDFDYMVSDLAPVDLLIQRAGRLHRHESNNSSRGSLSEPCIAISEPEYSDGLPNFGSDKYVYDRAILLRTWHVLQRRDSISLPEDTVDLIESVYGNRLDISGLEENFKQALDQAELEESLIYAGDVNQAKNRLVATPDHKRLLRSQNEDLEEDNPCVHKTLRALTRLSEPGVELICLHKKGECITLDPNGNGAPIDLNARPDLKMNREFLKRSVNVHNRDVVNYFIDPVTRPNNCAKSVMSREVFLVIFEQDGFCKPKGATFTLKLTRELGLEIL